MCTVAHMDEMKDPQKLKPEHLDQSRLTTLGHADLQYVHQRVHLSHLFTVN